MVGPAVITGAFGFGPQVALVAALATPFVQVKLAVPMLAPIEAESVTAGPPSNIVCPPGAEHVAEPTVQLTVDGSKQLKLHVEVASATSFPLVHEKVACPVEG